MNTETELSFEVLLEERYQVLSDVHCSDYIEKDWTINVDWSLRQEEEVLVTAE
jgi:hypothetical protein